MKRAACLDKAKRLVTRQRAAQHGDFAETYGPVAEMWSTYIASRHGAAVKLTAHDCAMMMALLKIGRAAKNPSYADNYVDGAGYLALAGEGKAR